MEFNATAVGPIPPYDINVVIEVSVGGEPIKHELDKAAGMLVVDGFLCRPMRYPINFGLVPHTLRRWRFSGRDGLQYARNYVRDSGQLSSGRSFDDGRGWQT